MSPYTEPLRCTLAGHKTAIHHADPAALQNALHLFPTESAVVHHITFGGTPVSSSPAAIIAALDTTATRLSTIVFRLLAIPALPIQLRLLVLTLSTRPSSGSIRSQG